MATVWTVGHGTRGFGYLSELVAERDIELVVDVRRAPRALGASDMDLRVLERSLAADSVEYAYLGDSLGGRAYGRLDLLAGGRLNVRQVARSERFVSGIAELVDLMGGRHTLLMCVEPRVGDCHRGYLLSAPLRERGLEVRHIDENGNDPASGGVCLGQLALV